MRNLLIALLVNISTVAICQTTLVAHGDTLWLKNIISNDSSRVVTVRKLSDSLNGVRAIAASITRLGDTSVAIRSTISGLSAIYQPIGTYATATSSTAFTNKTGNISQWTNNSGYLVAADIAGKLNKTDTAGMLGAYQTAINGKQASLGFTPYNATNPSGYITSASIAGKVNYTDTATMLSAYQTAINGKQASGTYATGTGSATNANTGDNAANTTYANDFRAANFVAGTQYLAPNGNGSALTNMTATQVGLGNVTNESKTTMFANPAFTGTPTGIGIPVYARVTGSNFTTTGQALVDITGLSVALTTNATYEIEAVLEASTTAVTTGIQVGINYNVAGGAIEAQVNGSLTTAAAKAERIAALNTATSAYLTTSAQTGSILIKGIITTGANAGNVTVKTLKVTSGTSTIFINSFLKVTRIN